MSEALAARHMETPIGVRNAATRIAGLAARVTRPLTLFAFTPGVAIQVRKDLEALRDEANALLEIMQ